MPIPSIDLLHGLKLGSTEISELTNCRPSAMIQTFIGRSAGQTDPQFVANMDQKPEITFDTPQLTSILTLCGAGTADLSSGNCDLIFRAAVAQGSRALTTDTAHKRFRAALGFLEWQRISASHNGEASISCRLLCGYDGTNSPLVYAGGVAANSITPSSADHWTTGPCFLNGTQIEGVQSISVERGGRLFQLGGDGEQYPTFQGEQTADPIISIVTPKTAVWADIGLNGVAVTSCAAYFRKIATVNRVATATTAHHKISAVGGIAYCSDTAGDGENPNMTTITIVPVAASGTVRALLVNLGVAIT